jgi:hypothetical protein
MLSQQRILELTHPTDISDITITPDFLDGVDLQYEPCAIISSSEQMKKITGIVDFLLPSEIYQIPITTCKKGLIDDLTYNRVNWVLLQIITDYEPCLESFTDFQTNFRIMMGKIDLIKSYNCHYKNGIIDGILGTLYVTTDSSCSTPLFKSMFIDGKGVYIDDIWKITPWNT